MVASEERRESDWSAQDFEEIEALYIHEASLCHLCGQPLEVCRDPDVGVMVEDAVCQFTASVEIAKRQHEADHKNDKRKAGTRFWSEGMTVWPRLMTDAEYEKYSGTRRD